MRSFTALAIGVAAAAAITATMLGSPAVSAEIQDPDHQPITVPSLSELDWEDRPSIFPPGLFGPVSIDIERLEEVHAGMDVPKLRQSNGQPVWGLPYYFFGRDETSGEYLPEYIALCIDVFHMRYHLGDDSKYFDLTRLVPEATEIEIIDIINAGILLAAANGLEIRRDGSFPLQVTNREAAEYLMAAQIKAWHLFARDSLAIPLPLMELSDFTAWHSTAGEPAGTAPREYDLSAPSAEIDAMVDRYVSLPSFDGELHPLDGELSLTDEDALGGFAVRLDEDESTPGALDYVDVTSDPSGSITIRELQPLDHDLTLVFEKSFPHGLGGGDYPHQGVSANMNDQVKAIISNANELMFEVTVISEVDPGTEEPGGEVPGGEVPGGEVPPPGSQTEEVPGEPTPEPTTTPAPPRPTEPPTTPEPTATPVPVETPAASTPTGPSGPTDPSVTPETTDTAALPAAPDEELATTGGGLSSGTVLGFAAGTAAILLGAIGFRGRRQRRRRY